MLLFDDGRCLKICDFGTAKLLDATSADTFIGTPYYLAPEVIEGIMLPPVYVNNNNLYMYM